MKHSLQTRLSLAHSRVRRALRWEFWPAWVLYAPVFLYILVLLMRYRGLSFTAANPALPGSGFIGEAKIANLALFQQAAPEAVADFRSVDNAADVLVFMQERNLDFPVVLKPDSGQRGADVAVIRSTEGLNDYFSRVNGVILAQEYIGGSEFGIFYTRLPNQTRGSIFSITEKRFPTLTGDGISSLRELILRDRRTHYMADFLLTLHENKLDVVLSEGEVFQTVEIGSHCRGSLFVDGRAHISQALEQRIDAICSGVPGYCFGRFDVRAPSAEALRVGEDLKILEANGVTSEATHIYDPKYSVFYAWRVLCKQWQLAFEIGHQNRLAGHRGMNLAELLGKVRALRA